MITFEESQIDIEGLQKIENIFNIVVSYINLCL